MQTTHDQYTPARQHKKLVLLCDHILSPANQGALFRLADAFGVSELIFIGAQPDMRSNRLKKTARNCQAHIKYTSHPDGTAIVEKYKNVGYQCIALEITKSSIPIASAVITSHKIVLLIGNEQEGISDYLLTLADQVAHIPMYGRNSSMNVVQATAIGLYRINQ